MAQILTRMENCDSPEKAIISDLLQMVLSKTEERHTVFVPGVYVLIV